MLATEKRRCPVAERADLRIGLDAGDYLDQAGPVSRFGIGRWNQKLASDTLGLLNEIIDRGSCAEKDSHLQVLFTSISPI